MKIQDFKAKKQAQQKISMITCYDYPSARIIAESQIDSILVGDSVAMTMHGHSTTIMATMEMLLMHTQAVARGLGKQFLVADLPFLTHKKSLRDTVGQVSALLQAGAQAVKIEGADSDTCQTIRHLVNAGIPVMGHIGLTAQSIHQLGGFKVQGKTSMQAELLLQQALDLEAAGCFALVIECVPGALAQAITEQLAIPSIGIGAGSSTDGQILVWHDLLGLHDFHPKFVKRYAQGKKVFLDALDCYTQDIQALHFPCKEETF